MNNELKVCSPVESSGATETSASRPSAPKRSTAAERMRIHRTRRRNGFYSIRVLLHDDEIDVLIRKNFLREDRRRNQPAIEDALNCFICFELGPPEMRDT